MHELIWDKSSQEDYTIDDWQFSPHWDTNMTFFHTWLEKHTTYWVIFASDFSLEKHAGCFEKTKQNTTFIIN